MNATRVLSSKSCRYPVHIEQVREHLWKSGPFIASDGEWSYRMVSREELLAILADEAERGEGS